MPLIFGTLVSSLLALLIAVPLSLGVAIYLTEFAPKVGAAAGRLSDRVAGGDSQRGIRAVGHLRADSRCSAPPSFPSSATLSDFFRSFRGRSTVHRCWRPGIILAIMVMPYIMSVGREVLLAVPNTQREAALALGATRWEAVTTAVLPYARSGIVGAVILGLGARWARPWR